jgi:hypothetical protein
MPNYLDAARVPIRYLGIPIHYRRLTNAEWKMANERLQLKLSSQKGKLLYIGGRLVFINSVPGRCYCICFHSSYYQKES